MASEQVKYKHTNRLIKSNSPYLLQHAHNPVDWYRWSAEAFEAARQRDKPVFLSIGYSSCHWCHVMEAESFSDEKVAAVMNDNFISIKVDREQRPDIDAVYMNAVQAMTGGGGWPLSVFLTAEGKPFYGGTYFPPNDLWGRPSFARMLLDIAAAWKNDRERLLDSASKLADMLEQAVPGGKKHPLTPAVLDKAYSYFQRSFDPVQGGFGGAPKFPQPANLAFLVRYWHRTKKTHALEMTLLTLQAMSKGGIYDHLGGGFHRYSVDEKWFVPHFEKMLYDQAQLAMVYVEAYRVTDDQGYAAIARDVLEYMLRDMTDPEGGYYAAEDADSEGQEGLFYLWRAEEIAQVLGPEDAAVFNHYYGVREAGNFEEGGNILHVVGTLDQMAQKYGEDASALESVLVDARRKLLAIRSERRRPFRDDKVIAGWNGLLISAMARAGAAMDEPKYTAAAARAADFVLSRLRPDGRLLRFRRGDRAGDAAYLDDYAFMIQGLLDLYEAGFEPKYLAEAVALADGMVKLFADPDGGGFFETGSGAERLIVRLKPAHDGAVPGGNAAAAAVLLRLGHLTGKGDYIRGGENTIMAFSEAILDSPMAHTAMLMALDYSLGPAREIVIAGNSDSPDTKRFIRLLQGSFMPRTVVLLHDTGARGKALESIAPFVRGQGTIEGRAAVYVCENFACRMPVTDIGQLEKILADKQPPGASGACFSGPGKARRTP